MEETSAGIHRINKKLVVELPRPWAILSATITCMDKLTEIMAHKRREIAPLLRPVFTEEIAALHRSLPRPPSFLQALKRADGRLAVIAEVKRRSPSAGVIRENASAVAMAQRYRAAGASALSILTDSKYFGGELADLQEVTTDFATRPPAPGVNLSDPVPCLRKDFMVHPVQVLQAREAGASAILIIVRALGDDEIEALHLAAMAAGLDTLFEIHAEDELARAVRHKARIIGVNNRDLADFKTDLGLSERLIPRFPKNVIAVSESGIATAADAARVKAAGAHAVLVGESLMRTEDPAAIIRSFTSA
jgi:indole-3-glycerol phosphate synthase